MLSIYSATIWAQICQCRPSASIKRCKNECIYIYICFIFFVGSKLSKPLQFSESGFWFSRCFSNVFTAWEVVHCGVELKETYWKQHISKATWGFIMIWHVDGQECHKPRFSSKYERTKSLIFFMSNQIQPSKR